MKLGRMIRPALALAAVLAVTGVVAQQSPPKAGAQTTGGQNGMMSGHAGMMGGNMAGQSEQMMAMHNQMMADMKAGEAKLDQKIAAMNAATGNAKIDAMAAVINEMAAQRKQMLTKMESMPDQMMAPMAH